jgi:hypothetical protein
VNDRGRIRNLLCAGLLLACFVVACRQEKQAVVGVAQTAVNAERKAQATASERDLQRAQLERIPLPTKSLYADVHDANLWANPLLSAGPDTLTLRINTDAAPAAGKAAAHHQESQIRPEDLAKTVAAIPPGAWRYGRVIVVAESQHINAKDRPRARRNVEVALQQLNDLGIVVEEWPAR